MKIAAIGFLMYRIYAKNFYVFCLYFSELLKIKKNIRLSIPSKRTNFHNNRLARLAKPSFEKNAFKVSERHFSYVSITYFFYLYIAAHGSYNSKLN